MRATRGTIWGLLLLAAIPAALSIPVSASAQMVVRTVIVGNLPVKETNQVRRSRFADMVEEPVVAVGTRLDAGDLIWAGNAKVLVELECTSEKRTPFRLSNGFRAVVLPPTPGTPCVLQLLAGGADVQAEEPTEINAGGIVLGSRGTQYAVRLRRKEGGAVCDGVVYDGRLNLRPPGRGNTALETGRLWTYDLAINKGQQAEVPAQFLRESAAIYTMFDLAQANLHATTEPGSSETRKQLAARLFRLHAEVLAAPANLAVRRELGTVQQQYGITAGARYNLRQLERVVP